LSVASSVHVTTPAGAVRSGIALFADARHFQIAALASLLFLHTIWFDLGASPLQPAVTITAALAAQFLCTRLAGVSFDWRSPAITGLSLSLLLRSQEPGLWVAAAVLAIGSKFLIRWNGKHFFNPANFAIVALLLTASDVWVSPGQWGSSIWLVFLLVCCGGLVLQRARRADTAIVFLGAYAGLLVLRAVLLGDPPAIPLHQLQSGALLIFAFFMITDPRSTPDRRAGRILFSVAVAVLAYRLQFDWQMRAGLFFALATLSPATPLIDRLLPATRFAWRQPVEV